MGWVEDKTGIDVTPIQMDEADAIADAVTDVVDGIGDFVGDIGEVAVDAIRSPVGQIAVSLAFPQYAAYINAAAKVANGEDLTAMDFVSLGIQGYSDLNAGIEVPANVQKAAKVAARIADGADPVTALVGAYGADFIAETDLGNVIENTVGDVLGEDAWQFVAEKMDINQAAADLLAGEDPLRMLTNQFGDEAVSYISSGDSNLEALGYAGIDVANLINEGVSPEQAILRGAREYYDRGGALPDLNELGSLTGIEITDLGLGDFLSEVGQDIKDFLPEMSFEGLKNLKDLGWDLKGVDFEGFDFGNIEGIDLPKLGELGLEIGDLDINVPQLKSALAFQGILEGQGGGGGMPLQSEDVFGSFQDNDLSNELLADTPSRAKQLLAEV
jgi:hypothetical protein